MKTKEASIKTSALSLVGIIALGGVAAWMGKEGGGAAQGALFSFMAMLPIPLFTSLIFPATAHFIRPGFSVWKWIALNLMAALLITTLVSIALCLFAGGVFVGTFTVTFSLLLIGLAFPGGVWLWMAK